MSETKSFYQESVEKLKSSLRSSHSIMDELFTFVGNKQNWRKEKPYLYEIIIKGFAFEEAVKKAQQNADELKALEEQLKTKKTH